MEGRRRCWVCWWEIRGELEKVRRGEVSGRIIRRRFPREVVISLSSSWPIQVKSRSARSRPISSQVWRMAGGA